MSELDTLVAEVRKLAADNADFVYKGTGSDDETPFCHYYPTFGNPMGCIVGAAMRNIGKPVDSEGFDGSAASVVIVERLAVKYAPPMGWVDAVQGFQDEGYSWSDAVARADSDGGLS